MVELESLISDYGGYIRTIVYDICPKRYGDDAYQEVLLSIWQNLDKINNLKTERDKKGLIGAISKRRTLDFLRTVRLVRRSKNNEESFQQLKQIAQPITFSRLAEIAAKNLQSEPILNLEDKQLSPAQNALAADGIYTTMRYFMLLPVYMQISLIHHHYGIDQRITAKLCRFSQATVTAAIFVGRHMLQHALKHKPNEKVFIERASNLSPIQIYRNSPPKANCDDIIAFIDTWLEEKFKYDLIRDDIRHEKSLGHKLRTNYFVWKYNIHKSTVKKLINDVMNTNS